jgi:hypothetical protein
MQRLDEITEAAPDLYGSTSVVNEVFFPLPATRRTALGILMWWESRRLIYNVIVGATGLVSLGVITAIAMIPPGLGPKPTPPWIAVLAYGAAANICYTLGPFVEIGLQKLWQNKVLPVGPTLFRQGLAFSVGLTLLPIMVVSAVWVLRVGSLIFGGSSP